MNKATEASESSALLVNDLKALASQLSERIREVRQQGFKVAVQLDAPWVVTGPFVRQEVRVRVWKD